MCVIKICRGKKSARNIRNKILQRLSQLNPPRYSLGWLGLLLWLPVRHCTSHDRLGGRRRMATAIGQNQLTRRRMAAAIGQNQLTSRRMAAAIGQNQLASRRMAAAIGQNQLTRRRMAAAIGQNQLTRRRPRRIAIGRGGRRMAAIGQNQLTRRGPRRIAIGRCRRPKAPVGVPGPGFQTNRPCLGPINPTVRGVVEGALWRGCGHHRKLKT
jgi:hypothetical protein